ncbi:MAG: hypothetical protein ACFFDW_16910 [Candidatus Thorarchaeota archaeon]
MAEINLTESIHRLDEIYSILLKGETDSGQEAAFRVEIIDILSTIQASILVDRERFQSFILLLENVREMLLNWDPFNQWFRQQKELLKTVYEVIVQGKNLLITQESSQITETSRLKDELDSLKSELSDLRSLMSELIKTKIISTSSEKSHSLPIMEPLIQEEEEVQTSIINKEQIQDNETREIETEEFPPIILPREEESEFESKELPFEEALESMQSEIEGEMEEEPLMLAQKTIKKLSQKEEIADKPSSVLSQMKDIIQDAEEQTLKQIQSFKESISTNNEKRMLDSKGEFKDMISEQLPKIPDAPTIQKKVIDDSEEKLVKPSEVLKKQEALKTSLASTSDPYMQLITLEAEKYRLEMGIEKNETDFQEGLKSKQEFDESIQLINSELVVIRQKIDSLRKELTS